MYQIALLLLFCTAQLSAAIFHEIDTTQPLCCHLSSKHHNRILVELGRIRKIIFPEEKLLVWMEEVSGQVFVQSRYPMLEPTVVSIITQDGLVQDIEMTFSDGPSEVIVLTNHVEQDFLELCDADPIYGSPSIDGSIESLLKGEIPEGYSSTPFRRYIFRPKFGISVKLVGKLRGVVETLCVYEVRNTIICKRKILEKEIACPGSSWTFLEKNRLCPKETILAIVAVPNE